MPRYEKRAQARERVVQELLHTHGLNLYDVDEHDVAALVREAMPPPPEFARDHDVNAMITISLPATCRYILRRLKKAEQKPTSLANKSQIISYIEDTEALMEEMRKRLEHLKRLLL